MANQYRNSATAYTGDSTSFTARLVSYNHTTLTQASQITGKSMNLLLNEAVDEYIKGHRDEWLGQLRSSYQDTIDRLGGEQ